MFVVDWLTYFLDVSLARIHACVLKNTVQPSCNVMRFSLGPFNKIIRKEFSELAMKHNLHLVQESFET